MVAGEVLAAGHTAEIHCGGGKGAGRGAVALGSVVKPSHLLHREWHRPDSPYIGGKFRRLAKAHCLTPGLQPTARSGSTADGQVHARVRLRYPGPPKRSHRSTSTTGVTTALP
jgi:hypothetical protein